jgi:exonuclease SbcD
LGIKGDLQLHLCPLIPKHDLRQLRGTFAQLTDSSFLDSIPSDDYLHIILTDEEDVPEAMGKLRISYPNLLKLSYDNTRTRTNQIIDRAEEVERKSPLTLFEELYSLQNNQPMHQQQREFVRTLLESIQEDSQ